MASNEWPMPNDLRAPADDDERTSVIVAIKPEQPARDADDSPREHATGRP